MTLAVPPSALDSLEQRLIGGVRGGDLTAFEILYRRHAGRVYASCLRLSGDPLLAEEFTQETFIRAWKSIRSFRVESRFATWLHRIAVNVVLAHRRSLLRRLPMAEITDDEERSDAGAGDPGARLDLERAIVSLPDGAREVFVLHEVEGYKHEEIAMLCGFAVGTSKAQLHRARSLLQKRLSL